MILIYDERDVELEHTLWGFPHGSVGKESACNARNPSSIPGSGRSLGEEKGYPLQYSGLENSMDCIVHGIAKSRTRLSDFQFHFSLGWKAPSLPLLEMFTCKRSLLRLFSPIVQSHRVYCCWHCSVSVLRCGMLTAIGPGVPQHRVHPSTGTGRLSLGRTAAVVTPSPGPAVGALEAAQALGHACAHMYVPTEPHHC